MEGKVQCQRTVFLASANCSAIAQLPREEGFAIVEFKTGGATVLGRATKNERCSGRDRRSVAARPRCPPDGGVDIPLDSRQSESPAALQPTLRPPRPPPHTTELEQRERVLAADDQRRSGLAEGLH